LAVPGPALGNLVGGCHRTGYGVVANRIRAGRVRCQYLFREFVCSSVPLPYAALHCIDASADINISVTSVSITRVRPLSSSSSGR